MIGHVYRGSPKLFTLDVGSNEMERSEADCSQAGVLGVSAGAGQSPPSVMWIQFLLGWFRLSPTLFQLQ